MEATTAKSVTSSTCEGGLRDRMERYFATWKENIMGYELAALTHLHWRIYLATVLVVLFCTLGFALTDAVLYAQVLGYLKLVDKAQTFRPGAVQVLFLQRSLYLAYQFRDEAAIADAQFALRDFAREEVQTHVLNYVAATPTIEQMYDSDIWNIYYPIGGMPLSDPAVGQPLQRMGP
jgi:hypothetical protein